MGLKSVGRSVDEGSADVPLVLMFLKVPLFLCFEFCDRRILGVREKDGDTAPRSLLLRIEVSVS